MTILLDTNILLRLRKPQAAQRGVAVSAIRTLQGRGDALCLVPQNLVEFWSVATRPARSNGLGWTVAQTQTEIASLKQTFLWKPDENGIFSQWETLVAAFGVAGRQVHDARLVAAMQVHGISQILTFNGADFTRYAPLGVAILDPANL